MARDRELRVIISGDPKGLQRAFGQAERSSSRLGSAFGSLAKHGLILGAALGGAVAVGAVKAIGAASDLGEQLSKTGVVFGKSGKEIHEWSSDLAQSFGLSQRAALEAAGTFGNMLVPMGFSRKEAAGLSKQFVELGADMASFNNASPAETLDALRAGLAGETEPLRRFGVFLNEARIKTEALSMGLYSGKGALDAQAKAAATAAIIMKDTADTQGDFARTSDSLANQQRILKAELENSAAAIGTALMPAAIALLGVIGQIIPVVTEWGIRLSEAVGPHITTAINALVPTFLNVKQAALQLIQTARDLLPTLQAIASPVFSFGVSSLGQSFAVAVISMFAFHKAAVAVNAALIQMRAAAAGVGLASLISPIGLLTAGVGLLAFAFYRTKVASDDVATSIDRQRTALEGLKTATNDAATSQQRLRDAKIALKQATLDVTTAIQRRNVVEKEGKKGTDEFKQAQLDVERAQSNRKRAEMEVTSASEALTTSTRKQSSELKLLKTNAVESTQEMGKLAANLQRAGKESESHVIIKRYAEEMARLAKGAKNVSEETAKSNPQLSTAAANFAKTASAAADYAKRTGEIPAALNAAVSGAGPAGQRIGAALGQGIKAGIDGQVAGIAAAAARAVTVAENAARNAARAHSPSELFALVGKDLGLGMVKGLQQQYASLSETGKTAVDKMVDAAVARITERRGAFDNAFSALTSAALAAFDKLSSEFQTKTEKKIAAQDAARAKADRQAALSEARGALASAQAGVGFEAKEGETPEEAAARVKAQGEAIKAAEQQVADAVFAIQRAADEKRAAQERLDYEKKRERQRFHLEQRLGALQQSFLDGEITVQQFTKRLNVLLEKAEIPTKAAATKLGFALAAGFNEAKKDVLHAARALVHEIQHELNKLYVSVRVSVNRADSTDDPNRAAGGPVKKGMPYIVGEQGPEFFVPSSSGTIIPNGSARTMGTPVGGNSTNVFNFPNYVGSQSELRVAMGEVIADYKRRNGGAPF